ncbi:ATP-dependent protease ATPase subunit HslU [Candidatus Nardonella dryophthoridicola]|uniref:ATP-dependent protease ATPase subunit HslU n=1 Tax=endosymbiont of Rhynchophorus ferrugineus TaxID=1972133 RepID=A0A2Z5T7J7_9GAMM|nr:ATP-dependent protease ATPase subunit HslU [Candidatus Nardonella dryophthoridicola]QTJ62792.1 ATP-dependent protease ATPase subunit HslU [Candidatus Nardonella dryophthoridicola]BBA85035.1 ATP-dependent protease ATPase subunit HslU [endosymbiont of Rhynchophorus ferrugineus]
MLKINPKKIVEVLNNYIIGQEEAKKKIAIAIINRLRRTKLKKNIKKEIFPDNILLIGPTGVGKTEIARRISKFLDFPFIRVEATKFTELGYVGKDVESIIKDLSEISFNMIKNKFIKKKSSNIKKKVENKIIDLLIISDFDKSKIDDLSIRTKIKNNLKKKLLENKEIEVVLYNQRPIGIEIISSSELEDTVNQINNIFKNINNKNKIYKLKVKEARTLLIEDELNKIINFEYIKNQSIKLTEEKGIVFIDEIDKICISKNKSINSDISNEGVQKDLLSLVEGSYIKTKYGIINTSYILFIASGAFHDTSPNDLLSEFKGRFPIKVKLHSLTKENLKEILKKPYYSIIKKYELLLSTDNIKIIFSDSAIDYISEITYKKNLEIENLGARRLHSIINKILEDIMFNSEEYKNKNILIDKNYVSKYIKDNINIINKYIL